LIELQCIN